MYFPIWKQEKLNDEFACDLINPFTLPRVKEMVLASCEGNTTNCSKVVSIFSYKYGTGFCLDWTANGSNFLHFEYLDCSGNVLCNYNRFTGERIPCNDDLGIDFAWTYNQNRKYILVFRLSIINY